MNVLTAATGAADLVNISIANAGIVALLGYGVKVYLENKTDKELMYTVDNVSVNGFMVNPYWSVSIADGKQAYSEIIFFRSELEKQDIEVIQNIEFRLQATDNNDWSADYLFDEVFTFKPAH